MPEYLAPGVYVEEVETGPRPIEGVSTSTTGFVGETERGPTKPRLLTSWEDYQRWFGGYVDRPPFNAPPVNMQNFYLPYAVRGFFDNGGQRLFVARVVGVNAAAANQRSAFATINLAGAGGPTVVQAIGEGWWGNNVLVAVSQASAAKVAAAGSIAANWFRIQIMYFSEGVPNPFIDPTDPTKIGDPRRRVPDVFEDFDNLTADSTKTNFAKTVINGASRLITIVSCPGAPTAVAFPAARLANGTSFPAVDADFLDASQPDPELRRGLAGLSAIREISIVAIPDAFLAARINLENNLQDACDLARDRFAIHGVSPDSGDVTNAAVAPVRDSSYGAIYYPMLLVSAPHTPDGYQYVPPVGHVAGIYARVDVDRGVHKAPANEVVAGIITRDLSDGHKPLSHVITKGEQDILNPKGVNVIRDFRPDGRDIRVWGARTMSSDSMWKYVNVRRLFIMIEQSIDRGTQWAVFEPNTEPTWIAVRTSIANFLRTVWRNGALMGTTEEEAFFVRCDRTTMTQDDFDNGRLICLIGIAPAKPAEFVIFRISQKTLESQS
jgi:phage tail sheath protein FI